MKEKIMSVENLIQWFLKNARVFPWREEKSPYKVWVSEVMLQQTVAKVVVPYFNKWMKKFPDIHSLAEASLQQVIKNWEGLGFYSRARRLHKAAKEIVDLYDGKLPTDGKELQKIQGLGPYTVGAILSFAYHQRAVAIDGNVIRVISRLYAITDDVTKTKTKKLIAKFVDSMLPEKKPYIVMEALIELGALVCRPKPYCKNCPMKQSCKALADGSIEKIPVKPKREKVIELDRDVLIFEFEGHYLLKKEQDQKKVMADLYEFPYFDKSEGTLKQQVLAKFITPPKKLKEHDKLSHSFTKYKACLKPSHYICYDKPQILNYKWIKKSELPKLSFSSGHRKILKSLL